MLDLSTSTIEGKKVFGWLSQWLRQSKMGADQSNPVVPPTGLKSQRDDDIPYTSYSISKPIDGGRCLLEGTFRGHCIKLRRAHLCFCAPEASISTGKLKRRKWSGAEISAGMFSNVNPLWQRKFCSETGLNTLILSCFACFGAPYL
jgi:hypothetical protein